MSEKGLKYFDVVEIEKHSTQQVRKTCIRITLFIEIITFVTCVSRFFFAKTETLFVNKHRAKKHFVILKVKSAAKSKKIGIITNLLIVEIY